MRVLVVVKANEKSEAGEMPSAEMMADMGRFNEELIAAGLMVDGAGLKPSSAARRVTWSKAGASVSEGPFGETRTLISGYWILNVKDMDEAVAWIRRAPMGDDAQVDIRPYFEPEDFAGIASDELVAQEKGWRDAQLGAAPKS